MLGASATHEKLARLLRDAGAAVRAMGDALGGDSSAHIIGSASLGRVCSHAAEDITRAADDYMLATSIYTHAAGGVNDSEGYICAVETGNYAQRIACAVEQACMAARAHDSSYVTNGTLVILRGGRRIAAQPQQCFRNPHIASIYRTLTDILQECTARSHCAPAYGSVRTNIADRLAIDAASCECGSTALSRDEDTSFIVCTDCGRMCKVEGTAYRDDHTFSQEGIRARTSDYHAMRHFEEWLPKILGVEKFDIDEGIIASLRAVMHRDDILPKQLDCRTVRRMLKDRSVNATYLNEHSTLIIKMLGGRTPPELSYDDANLIRSKYRIIADLYRTIEDEGVNQKYCPYFIYKIIEIFFEHSPSVQQICRFIHLQSDATLKNNDNVLAKIIEKTSPSDGFRVIKTDSQKTF